MKYSNITTENTVFVLISFEGPDCYSLAGGLGVRMQNLSRTLAEIGFTTHMFYIGDPALPSEDSLEDGPLILHRWGQWISRYHPGGVYDGEEGKLANFNDSLPGFVMEKIIRPEVAPDPMEIVSYIMYLKSYPHQTQRMRLLAWSMARYYTWEAAIQNLSASWKTKAESRMHWTIILMAVNPVPCRQK